MVYGSRHIILRIRADINLNPCDKQFLEYAVTKFYNYLNMEDIRLIVVMYDVIFNYINTICKGHYIIKYIDNDCNEKDIVIF